MQQTRPGSHAPKSPQPLPWYRYPWPWVAIAIPGVSVIGGLFTLYLASSNPDPLVVDEQQYQELRSELLAEPNAVSDEGELEAAAGDTQHARDGDY